MKTQTSNLFIAAIATAILGLVMPSKAYTHEYYTKSFTIIHPWANASEPGATSAEVYFRVEQISAADKLIGATTMLADKVELRESRSKTIEPAKPAKDAQDTKNTKGATTEPVLLKEITLPVDAVIELKPGGLHVKLVGLKNPLLSLRSYPMTLMFEKSGAVNVMVSVAAH